MPAKLGLQLAACLALAACGDDPQAPFRESDTKFRVVRDSLYNTIMVERDGDIVDMKFRVDRKGRRQTAVDLSDPVHLVIPYTRFMPVTAFIQPTPQRILLIGLGGGGLNRFLRAVYPQTDLTTAELDGAVLDMARDHMGYRPDEKDRVVIEDGRAFLKRNKEKWDWIFVDAFRDGAVPPHLKTREFYLLLKDHLSDGGAVAFNLHANTRLFESDKATMRSAFGEVHMFGVPGTGNVIALAFDGPAPDFARLKVDAAIGAVKHAENLRNHLNDAVAQYQGPADSREAPVLTDDYAPAEFLEQQR